MEIVFIFSCPGMCRDSPDCSGMFRNVPCSWFYRRPQKCAIFGERGDKDQKGESGKIRSPMLGVNYYNSFEIYPRF